MHDNECNQLVFKKLRRLPAPSLTIRNLDETINDRLRVRAATYGRSMEQEARLILREAVCGVTGREVWERSRAFFEGEKGVDIELSGRDGDRDAPHFEEADKA